MYVYTSIYIYTYIYIEPYFVRFIYCGLVRCIKSLWLSLGMMLSWRLILVSYNRSRIEGSLCMGLNGGFIPLGCLVMDE